jgi:hypothetical protein
VFRPRRSHQWHGKVERSLGTNAVISAAYVGQRSNHLPVPVNGNQAQVPGGPRPLDAVLPQIASVILTAPVGEHQYDALQVQGRKRYARGWSLVASYVWGHAFTNSRGFFSDSGQTAEQASFWPDPRNPEAEWGSSPYDVRHNLSVGWLADLPWGRGRRWLSGIPAALDAIVGGWSMAGIWKAHSGFAITVQAPDQSQTGARSGRPDRVGSGEGDRVVGPNGTWFDTNAFVLPARGTFGNAGVGIVRGPGLNVVDLALSKSVRLARGSHFDFRIEAFNLFNTPVFNAPTRDLTSGTFGQVRSAQLEREVQVGVRWVF